ncbi:L-tyrosine/L-tryptophan isonitrile synthase family protein [Marinomonas transparens]|uniref:L-tyrosine/L-tryptophan isonitrile synthase family protein n=1 Tax=Marinomonas transparens TaxID=2795388 RepID=A0A934JSC9_9GAMM|nr:L-tyrosine/L-tryptophan isonitrile synthase family protein [Marinomonas transparens]MBJ7539833.1 L-tyrosine/L-tryptophan isonitrile synthase family protein [Marinomonas transparens]
MNNIQYEEAVEKISFILLSQLIAQSDASFEGLVKLKEKIRHFVYDRKKIQLLLPAFPCKTNNLNKVLGHNPDIGEYLVLRKFVGTIRDIQAIYDPGVSFYVFSDYHTFSDYISVDLAHHYDYADGLKKMVGRMNASDSLKIVNFEDFEEFDGISDTEYFTALKDKFGDKDYEQNFSELKLRNNKMNNTYLGLKKFMSQDQQHILAKFSHKAGRKRLAEMAKGMMVQGKALDNFLQQKFADCIRLSIHEHPMIGKKYSLYLFDEPRFKTPWHSTMMFDAHSGNFLVDAHEQHLKKHGVIPVSYEDQPWCLIKLTASAELAPQLTKIRARLQNEKFGLILESSDSTLPITLLNQKDLNQLVKEFGTVTLRGFQALSEPAQMEAWYSRRGAIVPWQFGQLNKITPPASLSNAAKSTASLAIDWNLVCPPTYMGIHPSKYAYEDFTPHEFALYSHRNDTNQNPEASNVVIDSVLAGLIIDGQEREKLRQTSLKYELEENHLGTVSNTHPLIIQCPQTRQETLRWWKSGHQGHALEPLPAHQTSIETSPAYTDCQTLEARLLEICMDPRVCIRYHVTEGDLMLFNNHTTLQSMVALNGNNELWHMQLQPNSVNSPWQPYNRVELHQAS